MSQIQKPTYELVIEDINERVEVGKRTYGKYLKPFDGTVGLLEAYEEALDLVIYLRHALTEMGILKS